MSRSESPRVTEVIRAAGLMPVATFTDLARDRGTATHLACEYYDRRCLDESSLDSVIRPYFDAYLAFLLDSGVEILGIECKVEHQSLGYVGHFDRHVVLNGKHAILDLKTGPPQWWHGCQLVAYENAYAPGEGLRRLGLYLTANGRYKLKAYTDRADWEIFKAALTIYKTRQAWNLTL